MLPVISKFLLDNLLLYTTVVFLPLLFFNCGKKKGSGDSQKSQGSQMKPAGKATSAPAARAPNIQSHSKSAKKQPKTGGSRGSQATKAPPPAQPADKTKEESKDSSKQDPEKEKPTEEEPRLAVYPSVKEMTKSTKRKKDEEKEKEKMEKIAAGFFQSKSDEDDTLEQVQSLAPEPSLHGGVASSKKVKKANTEK